MYKEIAQRYMMRLRRNFDGALKITFAADKSKVGRFQTTLGYVYTLDREIGAMLPPQATPSVFVAACWAVAARRNGERRVVAARRSCARVRCAVAEARMVRRTA